MEKQHSISIILPVLNEEKIIAEQINYLRAHGTHHVTEILVVDGGSTDNTVDLARKASATLLFSEKKSRAEQMNLGADKAAGDILYFVHADTRPPMSFATDILSASQKGHPVGCYRYRFDSKHLLLRINAFCTRFSWSWCQGGDKTLYIPKALFLELGGFDPYYVVMEEYDFFKKLEGKAALHIIQKDALVSARKYQGRGWLRVQIANLIAFRQFRRGTHPQIIKDTYLRVLGNA